MTDPDDINERLQWVSPQSTFSGLYDKIFLKFQHNTYYKKRKENGTIKIPINGLYFDTTSSRSKDRCASLQCFGKAAAKIKCHNCNSKYHITCKSISMDRIRAWQRIGKKWICDDCQRDIDNEDVDSKINI